MARARNAAKPAVTKDIKPGRELIHLTDEFEILNLCKSITHLKLDTTCHMDRTYAKRWYEEHYLTGIHVRYVMKPGMSINHVQDGVVYRAFNCTDAIAERLMNENKAYIAYFDDLGPLKSIEEEPEVLPAPEEPEPPVEEAPVETPEAPVEEEEEAPVEPESPKEEPPVEEAPVEEAPVEEAPVETPEAPEAPVEEAPKKTVDEELAELG